MTTSILFALDQADEWTTLRKINVLTPAREDHHFERSRLTADYHDRKMPSLQSATIEFTDGDTLI